jgi:hypothetical protein
VKFNQTEWFFNSFFGCSILDSGFSHRPGYLASGKTNALRRSVEITGVSQRLR